MSMAEKQIIAAPDAPPSTSPVAAATKGGGLVFIGGQMPRDFSTSEIVGGAEAQARLSLAHCMALLKAAGSSPEKVMKATVFVTDLAAKPAVNAVFRETFGNNPPSRDLVEVSAIGEGAIVEISLIALA